MGLKLAAYRAAARAAALLPLPGAAERRRAADRWAAWEGGPVIWIHAASVGEALAAEPVMRRLRRARPDLPLVLTHTSPSVAAWPHQFPVARADYCPWETASAMDRAFAALHPALTLFSRSDLWPEMLLAAARHDVPVAVSGGIIAPASKRLSRIPRSFLRPMYQRIRFVGAVTGDDAQRWVSLGVPESAVSVTGDPRHDQVLERPSIVRAGAHRANEGPALVAGSVEPSDIQPLAEAFALVRERRHDARLIVVPHNPRGRVSEAFRAAANTEVVDTFGGLADEYLRGELAYVGGGYRGATHSTLEPAAFGIPTLTAAAGNGTALARQWLAWLEDPDQARAAGLAARRALRPGASSRTVTGLSAIIDRP